MADTSTTIAGAAGGPAGSQADYFAGIQAQAQAAPGFQAPAPSTTMDANAIANGGTTYQFPPNAPDASANASNAAATNASISTPTSPVVADPNTPTATQNTQTGILQKIANLVGGQKSLTTDQIEQEKAAGIPDQTKQINDLTTQLNGLTDQSNLIANATSPYGAIQNAQTLAESGGNISAAMTGRPVTKDLLLQNNIKQNQIAAQSLQLKSQILVLQNNVAAAKDAADKAAQVIFDGQTQQINYQKAQLDALAPQLSRDEKTQAAAQQAALTEKANQVAQQKAEWTAAQGYIAGALKANGTDPQAKLAVQQAMAIPNTDPNYLQKVGALLANYQADPVAAQSALLDIQLKKAQIGEAQANAAKTRSETIGGPGSSPVTTDANGVSTDPTVNGWVTAIRNGTAKLSDITAADLKRNPNLKNNVINAMAVGGNSTTDILNTTKSSLDELNKMVQDNSGFSGAVGAKGISSFFGLRGAPIPGTAAADFDLKLKQVKNDVILPNLTLLHGLGRVTDREFQALTAAVTSLSTDSSQSAFKTELANITTRINAKLKEPDPTQAQASATVTVQGKSFNVGQVYSDAKGNTGTFDATGKWIPQK